jgi:hypothetical protein
VQVSLIQRNQVFVTDQNLVEEVLDKLLLQRPRGEQAVEIGSEQFRHEVAGEVSFGCSIVKI